MVRVVSSSVSDVIQYLFGCEETDSNALTMVLVVRKELTVKTISFSDRGDSLGPKRVFCVDEKGFSTSPSLVHWHLASNTKSMA